LSKTEDTFLFRSERLPRHFWADNEVIDVFGPQLGCDGFAVYMALCRVSINGTGECSISLNKLASQLGVSKGGVFNALKKLCGVGLIRLLKPGDARNATMYQLADVKSLIDSDHRQLKLSGHNMTTKSAASGHGMTSTGHHMTAAVTTRPPNKEDKTSSKLKTTPPNPPQAGVLSMRKRGELAREIGKVYEASVGATDDPSFPENALRKACLTTGIPVELGRQAMIDAGDDSYTRNLQAVTA
jgi:hypothetical protein